MFKNTETEEQFEQEIISNFTVFTKLYSQGKISRIMRNYPYTKIMLKNSSSFDYFENN